MLQGDLAVEVGNALLEDVGGKGKSWEGRPWGQPGCGGSVMGGALAAVNHLLPVDCAKRGNV